MKGIVFENLLVAEEKRSWQQENNYNIDSLGRMFHFIRTTSSVMINSEKKIKRGNDISKLKSVIFTLLVQKWGQKKKSKLSLNSKPNSKSWEK